MSPNRPTKPKAFVSHTSADHDFVEGLAADNIDWRPEKETVNSWQAEWNVLLDAIRNDRPHNEARRALLSNFRAIVGRGAVHSGKIITWDEAMASDFRFRANVDTLKQDSPPPIHHDEQGGLSGADTRTVVRDLTGVPEIPESP